MIAPAQTNTISATHPLAQATERTWDVLVVGAGPAGASAARGLAGGGRSVLLVDKNAFPRDKVCGCCVSAEAMQELDRLGLTGLPRLPDAGRFDQLHLATPGRRSARLPLRPGLALSRASLDAALVRHAVRGGVWFSPRTTATLAGFTADKRVVKLRSGGHTHSVTARLVLAANGLGGTFLRTESMITESVHRRGPIGLGAIANTLCDFYQPGTVFMACSSAGYVGLVVLGDRRANMAACVDPAFVRHAGGPGPSVAKILFMTGLPAIDGVETLPWCGTPHLTRRCLRPAAKRLFVLGDAARYTEPMTGQGISWALDSARAVVPLAAGAIERWEPDLEATWARQHHRLIGRRQRPGRVITRLLRWPTLSGAAVMIAGRFPLLARPVVQWASGSAATTEHANGGLLSRCH